jgi:hypothetical protein
MVKAPTEPRKALLVAVDLLALVLFVLVGLGSHHEVTGVDLFARNAIPLVVSWCLFAAVLKTYRQSGMLPMVRNWMVAVPAALVIRSVWVGSPQGAEFLVFLAVGMGFTLLFLIAGRGLIALATGHGWPRSRGTQ